MKRFIWFTYGNSRREMRESKSVIVHADNEQEAREKVIYNVCDGEEGELRDACNTDYGMTWFLQEIAEEELR